MSPKRRHLSQWFYLFAGYLLVVPMATIGAAHYMQHRSAPAAVAFAVLFGCFLLAWIYLIVWARRSQLALRNRKRLRRAGRHARKSPWGERRVEEPTPYSDRLASFLSTTSDGDKILTGSDENFQLSQQPRISTMNYWSIVEIPRPSEPPKPLWYLRRLLQRIQEAIRN